MSDAFLLDPELVFLNRGSFGPCLGAPADALAFVPNATAVATMQRALARNGLAPTAANEDFVQMVAIRVRTRDAAALQRRLFEDHRIEVPVTQHGDTTTVRKSVQAYNTPAAAEALRDALAALSSGPQSAPPIARPQRRPASAPMPG